MYVGMVTFLIGMAAPSEAEVRKLHRFLGILDSLCTWELCADMTVLSVAEMRGLHHFCALFLDFICT